MIVPPSARAIKVQIKQAGAGWVLGVQVAVSPLLACFLCVSGIKHKVLHDEDGRWGLSFVAWRKPLGGPVRGRGPSLCPQDSALNRDTSTSLQVGRQPHTRNTHGIRLSLSLQSRIPLTHPHTRTPLWCQCPHWSRCLDDIVKQLHGLHDVLILQRGKRCAWVYVEFVALWRVMCRK